MSQIVSQPIRRVSRHHDAPLSLEILQVYFQEKSVIWKEESLFEMAKESGLFGAYDKTEDEALRSIKDCLEEFQEVEWFHCPLCDSTI